MANNLQQLTTELTQCAICLGELKDPRCLPCLHSFCERCLHSSLKVYEHSLWKGNNDFHCPNCRKKTTIPHNGITGFPKDFKANKISEFLKNLNTPNSIPQCDFCIRSDIKMKSKIFCCDCRKHFCANCEESVHNKPVFESHVTLNINIVNPLNVTKCAIHPNEVVSFLCRTCDINTCILCACNIHLDHDLVQVDDRNLRSEHLTDDLLYVQGLVLDLQKNIDKLSAIGRHLSLSYEQCAKEIKLQSKKLQDVILANEQRCLQEVDQVFYNTSSKLFNKKDHFQQLMTKPQNLLLVAYNLLSHGFSRDWHDSSLYFEKQIESFKDMSIEINNLDLNNTCTEIQFLPVDNLSVGTISQYHNTNIWGINTIMDEINNLEESGQIKETLPDIIEDNDSVKHFSKDHRYMQKSNKKEEPKTYKGSNEDQLSFNSIEETESRSNDHKRRLINHSQKHSFTHLDISQKQNHLEGNCEEKTDDYMYFKRITPKAILPKFQMSDNKIHVQKKPYINPQLNIKAKLLTAIDMKGRGQGHLMEPFSVCFNPAGDIVIGELGNKRLQVFDINGSFKQILGFGHVVPLSVVVMDTDRYLIADDLTKSIKIISAEGDIKNVKTSVSFPYAVCIISRDSFVVTDSVFDSINKININGDHICQYSSHGNSLNDLDNPSSLHVTENPTIFVTDTGNHQIKLLDNDLNLLYKFGCYGDHDGGLRYPRGITGTKEILLYQILETTES